MKEEIKNRIDAESKEKRKLNDADLAQVTGGVVIPGHPWDTCDRNCGACNVSQCLHRENNININNMYT